MPLIHVKNIYKTYENEDVKTRVLRGISFDIEKGEFVAIMGPSGSGKSTLMHILGLLERTTSGRYNLDNKDVAKLSDDELARLRNEKIGFVFQAFYLMPRTSILENVKMPLMYSAGTRQGEFLQKNMDDRAKEVLESVGLSHRLDHHPSQISGGEKQRVAIARALVNNPSVIFADEPTGNLDSKSGMQVMKILQNLNKQGNTIILVTHETYTAEHAKRIIQVKDGEIIKDHAVRKMREANDGEILK